MQNKEDFDYELNLLFSGALSFTFFILTFAFISWCFPQTRLLIVLSGPIDRA